MNKTICNHFDFILTEKNSVPYDLENPFPNEHSARVRDPNEFKEKPDWSTKGKFRRTAGGTIFNRVKVPVTIGIIWGQLKQQKGQAAFPQSLRFPIKNWTATTAKKWLKDNKVKHVRFEAAEPTKKDQSEIVNRLKKNETWFEIEDKKDGAAEVYIYDEIGAWGVSARQFAADFNKIKASKVNVHINSPGGAVFDGMAIYNTLNNSKNKIVNTFIEGLAASMASVIALAGDYVTMLDNSLYMIHNPRGLVAGESKEAKKMAEILDKIKAQIITVYQKKTGIETAELEKLMDNETWLDSKEALLKGFIDNIDEGARASACFDLEKFNYKNLDKYTQFKNIFNLKNEGGQKMELTLEELKLNHPEIYQAAFEEGKVEGIKEGKTTGTEEAKKQGAEAERKRIQSIEGIDAQGAEKVISENKFKPEATKESVSVLVLEAQKKPNADLNNANAVDSKDLNTTLGKISGDVPQTGTEEEENKIAKDMAEYANAN